MLQSIHGKSIPPFVKLILLFLQEFFINANQIKITPD